VIDKENKIEGLKKDLKAFGENGGNRYIERYHS
jgi:hypothetical protein